MVLFLLILLHEILSDKVTLKFDVLKDETVPAMLNVDEHSRRMEEMMRSYGMDMGGAQTSGTLVLNTSSALVKKLCELAVNDRDKAKQTAAYLYKLSLLSQKKFSAEEMQSFMHDSFDILMKL